MQEISENAWDDEHASGYNHITFHRATDTRSGNEFSIGMINGKTGAKLEPGAKN